MPAISEFETSSSKPKSRQAGTFEEQAQSVGQDIKKTASGVTGTVVEAAQEQADKVGAAVKHIASDASGKIQNALNDQRASGANYLGNVANVVHEAADVFESEIPQAAQYIHRAADQIDNLASAVRTRDVRDLINEVQDFARRQPAIFFGGALLLGFAAIRFLKTSAPSDGSYEVGIDGSRSDRGHGDGTIGLSS